MAKKPANGNPASHERTPSDREKIIAAFLALLAEQRIERIGFADVAGRAEVSLATLRGEFPSLLAIYAAHVREIDRKVLSDLAIHEPAAFKALVDQATAGNA